MKQEKKKGILFGDPFCAFSQLNDDPADGYSNE